MTLPGPPPIILQALTCDARPLLTEVCFDRLTCTGASSQETVSIDVTRLPTLDIVYDYATINLAVWVDEATAARAYVQLLPLWQTRHVGRWTLTFVDRLDPIACTGVLQTLRREETPWGPRLTLIISKPT